LTPGFTGIVFSSGFSKLGTRLLHASCSHGAVPFWSEKAQKATDTAEAHQRIVMIHDLDSGAGSFRHPHNFFLDVEFAYLFRQAFRTDLDGRRLNSRGPTGAAHPASARVVCFGQHEHVDLAPFECLKGNLHAPVLRGPGGRKAVWLLGNNPFWAQYSTALVENPPVPSANHIALRALQKVLNICFGPFDPVWRLPAWVARSDSGRIV